MDEAEFLIAMVSLLCIFVVLPWIVFHYVTQWKGKATMTGDDEQLLRDLYDHARRIDERLDVIERIAAADNPDVQLAGRLSAPDPTLDRLDALERELNLQKRS